MSLDRGYVSGYTHQLWLFTCIVLHVAFIYLLQTSFWKGSNFVCERKLLIIHLHVFVIGSVSVCEDVPRSEVCLVYIRGIVNGDVCVVSVKKLYYLLAIVSIV